MAVVSNVLVLSMCLVGDPPLATELVVGGLDRPLYVTHAPGDEARLFVVEKRGRIKIIDLVDDSVLETPFLDIDAIVGGPNTLLSEQGLLGLAFHPEYDTNGFFFVNYTDNDGDTVVARFTVSADPNVADAGSIHTVMLLDQPFINHNGGWMAFGPNDGLLYIATGDGGFSNDPDNRAQTIVDQLHGKILRLDVDGDDFPKDADRNYAIPASNPFVGVEGDDEIWSYGLRHPWRPSFDRETGDLFIADVGQGTWEEVNVQPASSLGGENYGWRCMEASECTGLDGCTCDAPELTLPVYEYIHGGIPFYCSITGGYVYRGASMPALHGAYFFADYCAEEIWSFRTDGATVSDLINRESELDPDNDIRAIASFGEDARGELYVVDHGPTNLSGEVWRVVLLPLAGDVDGDGFVNVNDLLIVLSTWGPCDVECAGDVDDDGEVSTDDILIILGSWS